MIKLFWGLFIVGMMTAVNLTAVTAPDPTDYTLVAYKLTPAQEASFSNTDGVESGFWKCRYRYSTIFDYMHLVRSLNARAGAVFESDDDAQVWVLAAWGQNGLYLYFKVLDDDWVDYPLVTDGDWINDAIDFFLDGDHSSDDLYADPTLFYYMRWTMSMVHYQFNFGGSEAPITFRYSKFDPSWNANTGNVVASIKYERKCFAEGEGMGIYMEAFESGDYVYRFHELLISWEQVSNNGIAVPAIGDKIAAVFGYIDVDSKMVAGVNELRWRISDPYSNDNCWGDIEFGETLEHISSSLAVLNPSYKSNARNGKVLGSEFYSVIGKKLPVVNGKVVAPRNSIVIERQLTSTGIKAVQFLAK